MAKGLRLTKGKCGNFSNLRDLRGVEELTDKGAHQGVPITPFKPGFGPRPEKKPMTDGHSACRISSEEEQL